MLIGKNGGRYPCKGCKDRYVGCHSDCKLYLDKKDEFQKDYKARKKEMELASWYRESIAKHKREAHKQ